jgi:hypothetical protein
MVFHCWFHVLAVVNVTTVNMGVQVSLWHTDFKSLDMYVPLLDHIVGLLCVLKNLHTTKLLVCPWPLPSPRVFRRCLLKNCAQNLQLFAGGLGKTLFFHPEVEGYIALIKQNFAAIFQKHLVVIYKPWDMIQMTPSGVV